jgi:hypothetical protein
MKKGHQNDGLEKIVLVLLKIKDNILLEQVLFKQPQIFGSYKDNQTF